MLSEAPAALSAVLQLTGGRALPSLGTLAPAVNLIIDAALVAFLLYILIAARKGR